MGMQALAIKKTAERLMGQVQPSGGRAKCGKHQPLVINGKAGPLYGFAPPRHPGSRMQMPGHLVTGASFGFMAKGQSARLQF